MLVLANPYLLFLIPCCVAYFIFTAVRHSGKKDFLYITIRSVVAILLIFALAGTKIRSGSNLTSTIFAIDSSSSMNGTDDEVLELLKRAEAGRGENDIAGAVAFGQKSFIAFPPGYGDLSGAVPEIRAPGSLTNIEQALRFSQTVLPEESKKRITLISDGLENAGEAAIAANLLRQKNIIVDVFHLMSELVAEVQLNEMRVPPYLRAGVRYDIEVRSWSLAENTGRMLIYRNDEIIVDSSVDLRKGENKLIFSDLLPEGLSGGVIYRAEILPEYDTYSDNNMIYAYSYAEGAPSILAVGRDGSEREIVKILQASGANMGVTVKSPYELVMTQEELNIYDAVVLANVSADDLPEGFADLLESYVRNQGGGLVVSGGDNAFGLGGYENTPLETVLPVEMSLQNEDEQPDIGMVIVLDRSGSMAGGNYGISKLELAKEAVIRSIDTLNDADYIGVLTFDDMFDWVVKYTKTGGNRDKIKNSIADISPGGGTSILPALGEAFKSLEHADIKVKHIILLTDGQAERNGYDGLINSMRQSGITLSTIAIGSDADTELLGRLALLGNGRYYFTNEFTDLPKIFTKETKMAGRRYLNEERFYPAVGAFSEILTGIEALPALGGYISATAKPRADSVLVSERGEPVLAAWQYGLGRSIAWTSDMGSWASEWLDHSESVTVFRNMLSWSVKKHQESQLKLDLNVSGGNAEIKISLPYGEPILGINAIIKAPDLSETEVIFDASAPGEYIGVLQSALPGAYIAAINVVNEADATAYTEGFCVPYSEEYDMRHRERGESVLYGIAKMTGGRVLEASDDVFYPIGGEIYTEKNISDLLIFLSLLLFLVDVFLRRFMIKRIPVIRRVTEVIIDPNEKIPAPKQKPVSKVSTNIGNKPEPGASQSTSSALVSQKKKRLNAEQRSTHTGR